MTRRGTPAENEKKRAAYAALKRDAEQLRAFASRVEGNRLLRVYGISADEYARRFAEQGGVCGLCRKAPTGRKRLSVDHDHATGAVRGLLCTQCNTLIGMARESAELLRRAATYVEGGGA